MNALILMLHFFCKAVFAVLKRKVIRQARVKMTGPSFMTRLPFKEVDISRFSIDNQ